MARVGELRSGVIRGDLEYIHHTRACYLKFLQ